MKFKCKSNTIVQVILANTEKDNITMFSVIKIYFVTITGKQGIGLATLLRFTIVRIIPTLTGAFRLRTKSLFLLEEPWFKYVKCVSHAEFILVKSPEKFTYFLHILRTMP